MISVEEPKTEAGDESSAPHEHVVVARGLTKVFKDFWGRPKAKAVNDVDFEVRKGEVLGLLGPNGSGKTTTVKMMLGLLYPTKGHIEVFGQSPRHVGTKARIGYLPEESYLYRYLDSDETLGFFGSLFKLESKERQQRAEQLIEMVGLKNARNRLVGEFSKGMQRRIGLAQALINDPDLVILDEPTSGLDPIGCREIKDLILALADRGKTVILSSHLLSDVEDVCDRVVIYYGGRVQAAGGLKDLLKEPDTIQISSPVLPKETLKRVLDTIRTDVDAGAVRVDNPTQNLESYFLGVVKRAKEAETHTSGATSGSSVAPYLRGDAETTTVAPRGVKVLERLTRAGADESAEKTAPVESEAMDHGKLDQLSRSAPEPEKAPEKQPEAEQVREQLDEADDKLSSLVDKPKD